MMSSGVRLDDHSEFGSETTWRVSSALFVPETGTKFSATLGTGFKAPSLIQLYSSFGNPELEAEKSRGWDAGVTQKLFEERVTFEAKYFWNSLDNLVTFNPGTLILENISEARTSGVETGLRLRLSKDTSCGLTWTYLDSVDESTELPLLRRARNKLSFDLSAAPLQGLRTSLWLIASGSRADTNYNTYPTQREQLGGYVTVNLSAEYAMTEQFKVFVRGENLLDAEYEEVLGYAVPGATVFGGVSFSL